MAPGLGACYKLCRVLRVADVSREGTSVAYTPRHKPNERTQRENTLAQHAWNRMKNTSKNLDWKQIERLLAHVSTSAIARQIGVSRSYATLIGAGPTTPASEALAGTCGVGSSLIPSCQICSRDNV
jgi:hypothetical protein